MCTFFGTLSLSVFSVYLVLGYEVERLPSPRSTVGEVPHWDAHDRSLYYVDIADDSSSLLRYDYDENRVYQASIDNASMLLFLLPIEGAYNHFLVGIGLEAVIVYWNGRSSKAIVNSTLFKINESSSNVINDIKTDKFGRFYGGTKSVESCDTNKIASGEFYRYNTNEGLEEMFDNVFISNGLTWVRSTNKFYYADSCNYSAIEFDWDPQTGKISNAREIFSLIENGMKPDFIIDGMTNDVDGNLYFAAMGGSKIIKFNTIAREVVLEIRLPATQITSLAFGGPKLDILYVTTANKDGKQPSESGYLYKITGLNATGYAGVKLDLY